MEVYDIWTEKKAMEPKKLTLGQAIDAMLEGKEVVIGSVRYRFKEIFEAYRESRDTWYPTYINSLEVTYAKNGCHIYTPPIKWKKDTWLEALQAVYREEGNV